MKFITIMIISMMMVVAASIMVQSKSRETFIVNGSNAVASVRYFAYLEIFRQSNFGGPSMYFGGGTVISTSFILTCAQNVAGFNSWRVGLGSHNISDMQWFLSTTAFTHHGYNNQTLLHNVALIRLTQLTTMGTGITIMSLPTASSTVPVYANNVDVYGFGFGATDHQPGNLRGGTFRVTTQKMCEDMYPHLSQTGHTLNHFCGTRTAGNICAGDQGGPVISGSRVVGIQSFYRFEDCRSPEAQPAAFIRVPRYVAWINNVTSTQRL